MFFYLHIFFIGFRVFLLLNFIISKFVFPLKKNQFDKFHIIF